MQLKQPHRFRPELERSAQRAQTPQHSEQVARPRFPRAGSIAEPQHTQFAPSSDASNGSATCLAGTGVIFFRNQPRRRHSSTCTAWTGDGWEAAHPAEGKLEQQSGPSVPIPWAQHSVLEANYSDDRRPRPAARCGAVQRHGAGRLRQVSATAASRARPAACRASSAQRPV